MKPYFVQKFGNASSIHNFGQQGCEALDKSRSDIAKIINCEPEEIVFTSGGSEADNLAILGIVEGVIKSHIKDIIPHVITSQIEHKAILETVRRLENEGIISATYVRVNRRGLISPHSVRKAVRPNTILVSIMYVNNETGVIQPIRDIGKIIEKINKKRMKSKDLRIYFHTDAVQAAGFLELNTQYLHIDLMTISAHKIYGPKGIGLLYLKKGVPLSPQITGGEQEGGRRAGTENVASIVGLAAALKLAKFNQSLEAGRIKNLRDYLERKIKKEIPAVSINGGLNQRVPHISNLSFKGAEGESILLSLDLDGIAASSGSACTSGSLEPSHVLVAMGVNPLLAQSSIRFSLGKMNTKKELDMVVKRLKTIIKRLRKISVIEV